MRIFIDFWKLETENNLSYVFSFFHKLSFENSFCFLSILGCQTSFLVSKIENCFWKHKIRGKISYKTYPKLSFGDCKQYPWTGTGSFQCYLMTDLLEICRMGFLRLIVGEHGLVVAHFKKVIENLGISRLQGFALYLSL